MPQPKYTDFTEYILGITAEIWEGRGIHLLHDYYSEDIRVRSPSSVVVGNREVIHATRATLCEFPDRRLLGEDVIWEHTGVNSWYSSHRIFSMATHSGHGAFGTPTGRRLAYRVIADCHAGECPKSGWIVNDEWLVRDFGAILRALGLTAKGFAEEWLAGQISKHENVRFPGHLPGPGDQGPYRGSGNASEPGLAYEELLQSIMADEMSAIGARYDPACQIEWPGGRTGHGVGDAERLWFGLRASFPQAEFRVENRIGRTDSGHPPRAAIRWSLQGSHAGHGQFGEPTGGEVYVMGISHAEFGPRGLKREFVQFDEVAVWQQILTAAQRNQ